MRIKIGRPFILLLTSAALGTLSLPESWSPVRVSHAGFYVPGDKKVTEKRSLKPVSIYLNSIGTEFVLIPAGRFLMGSEHGDPDEKPPLSKRIARPFYLAKHEVTRKEWFAVMKTRPWDGRPNVFPGDDYPAVYINWHQARDFMQRLNKREHCSCYRLPTEVEWEYAARAGTLSEYSFGEKATRLGEFAWFAGNSKSFRSAHPVGGKKANPWGLYDMHGNVWEWVQDWEPRDVGSRIRGGSWASPPSSLRSSNRSAWPVEKGGAHIGFRILREIP